MQTPMIRLRTVLALLAVLFTAIGLCQGGTVALEAYPAMTVADGRSTLTLTALVRDDGGRLVPDGTQVVFDTSLGQFREKVATTKNGYARVILVAGNLAGISHIRASVLRFNAAGEFDVEFVADRSMLSAAKDYIEVDGTESLWYSVDDHILEVTGVGGGAKVVYKDITIIADDMQVKVPAYEVRARKATLTLGKKTYKFDELFFRLNRRQGIGLGTAPVVQLTKPRHPYDLGFKVSEYFGLLEIDTKGVRKPTAPVDDRLLVMSDISASLSKISAKKAIAFPRKEIQFQKASIHMANQPIMQVPLFRQPVNASSPLITDDIIRITDSGLAINYPYYTTLKPGLTSNMRLRVGNSYATGTGASRGAFLDYEMAWNKGDHFDGGMTVFGLGRSDWGFGVRQMWSNPDSTTLTAQLDFPAHRSAFASANLGRQFDGFSANLNGNFGKSISGSFYQSNSANLVVEKDPMSFGKMPFRLFLGLTASQSSFSGQGTSSSQQAAGIQARLVSNPFRLSKNFSLNATYTLGHMQGSNVTQAITQVGTLNISGNPAPGLSINASYEFLDDGFISSLLGHHKVGLESYYQGGPWAVSAYMSRSLDVDRLTASARMRYQLGPLWKLSYGYYFDQFGPDSFLDQSVIVSYKLGFREIGISYSGRTKRLGLEFLGAGYP